MPKFKSLTILFATCLSANVYASSYTANIDIPQGGWYQGVDLPVNADTLDVKSGDDLTIETSIATTGINSSWGSLTLGNCNNIDQFKTTCKVNSVNTWSNNLSFGINAPGVPFSAKTARITISANTQEKSKATIEVQLPEKPTYIEGQELATVQIHQNGTLVGEVSDTPWGKTAQLQVEFAGKEAGFTVNVPALEKGKGVATPSAFQLSNNETQTVKISYQAPEPILEGNIEIKASTPGSHAVKPSYQLKNAEGKVIDQGTLSFDQSTLIQNLPTTKEGQVYTLEAEKYADDGFIYTAESPYALTVNNGKTTNAQVVYTQKVQPSEQVSITVHDFPKGKKATLTLANDKGDKRTLEINNNDPHDIDIPQDGQTWTVTLSAIVGYGAEITPTSFVASSDSQTINISYHQVSNQWPDQAIVGYVRGYDAPWPSQPATTTAMIKTAAEKGYNVFVYAFAGQKPDGEPFLVNFLDSMLKDLPNQLNVIHNHNGIALLSIGGAENYFDPDLTGDKARLAGQKMGQFLADHHFDGLDIDVEHPNATATDENLTNYINAMRATFKEKTGKHLYLTAAPQISGWYGSGQWASGSAKFAEQMYTQEFMQHANFDAVFIQTYNQYGGANFAGLKGFDTGFLSMTFKLLSPQTRAEMPGVPEGSFSVPLNTKIILGVPNYKAPSVSEQAYRQGQCLADASCSGVGLYNPKDINHDITQGGLKQYSQYGGLMTWILNSDAYQGWSWVDGVKDSLR